MPAQLQGLQSNLTPTMQSHIQSVRLYLRDFAELNQLIQGEETSDRMLVWSTLDFVSDFNSTGFFTSLTLEDLYNRGLQHLCVRGTTITVLQSLTLVYNRNHLPFSDGGLSVNINDKAPFLLQLAQTWQSAYEQNKAATKIKMNIENLIGYEPNGLFSDYAFLTTYGYF